MLVDYYADWRTSCKSIEKEVFGDPQVLQALSGVVLLRADVTASNAAQRSMMQRHQVMSPPTARSGGLSTVPIVREHREARRAPQLVAC